jgi:excisionase family DNA binding protein
MTEPAIRPAYPRLVGRREAAGHLCVGVDALDDLIRAGKIRAKKIGKFVKVPMAEIDRYIAELPDHRPGRVA